MPSPTETNPEPGPTRGNNSREQAADVPLTPIALALSGGGFRAAGFHLGTLKLLHDVGLLDEVDALSTVSGGTIVGACWILSRARGETFDSFYSRFYGFLEAGGVMPAAIEQLARPVDGKPPSLIRAAAQVYDDRLFKGALFKEVLDSAKGPPEVSFNATEFRTGVHFRFQRSASTQAVIGNGNVRIGRKEAENLHVADIVAASSCFPGGFEPMVLPGDFATPGLEVEGGPVALMDGGIYDNQGIDALQLAMKRANGLKPGLVIISDTTQDLDHLYTAGKAPTPGSLRVRTVYLAATGALAAVTLVLLGKAIASLTDGSPYLALLDAGPALVTGILGGGLVWLRGEVTGRFREAVPSVDLDHLGDLTVREFVGVVEARLRSLVALTGNVFMKRVRQLVFRNAYSDERLTGRILSNLIYRMPEKQDAMESLQARGWKTPTEQGLVEVVATASAMPTTLWFTDPSQLPSLVRCGYASMCFNLGAHVLKRYQGDPSTWPPGVAAAWGECERIWKAGAKVA